MHGTSTQHLFARSRKARFAELVSRHCAELGNDISEGVRSHVRRIAYFQCVLEDIEQSYVQLGSSTPKERTEYSKIAAMQSKLMRSIGLINASPQSDDDADDDLDSIDIADRARLRPSTSRPHRERL